MGTAKPDELVTLVDGTYKFWSEVTPEEEQELAHWRTVRQERWDLAAERKRAGLPPLCSFYDRPGGRFCTEEGANVRKHDESGMNKLPLCDRHLKVWYT